MRNVLIAVCLFQAAFVYSLPLKESDLLKRKLRSPESLLLGCISMESFPGEYQYKSDGTTESVCGLFLIGLSNQVVEIEFTDFDIDCDTGGLLSVVDGWELNGQLFPGVDDHDQILDERIKTFCGMDKPNRILISSQNVALIQFRIPKAGEGFRVAIRFPRNSQPCNVVSMYQDGFYTLRNYGQKRNCSVSIIYPERIKLIAVDVGVTAELPITALETGLASNCRTNDYVELKDGDGLDTGMMKRQLHFCGMDSTAHASEVVLGCQHSVVRLVSSGRYYNSVTFTYEIPNEEAIKRADTAHC